MSIYEQHRSAVNIPPLSASPPLDGELVAPPFQASVARTSTDGMMLLSHARERMMAERLNADMARERLALVHELRHDQRDELVREGDEIWAVMLSRRDNPLVLGALQRSFEREEEETDWTIRYALRRGW